MSPHHQVLLVEPDAALRLTLSGHLTRHKDIEVLARASSLDAALLQLTTASPNLLLIGAAALRGESLEAVQQFLADHPGVKLIALGKAKIPLIMGMSCSLPDASEGTVENWVRYDLIPLMNKVNKQSSHKPFSPKLMPRLVPTPAPASPPEPPRLQPRPGGSSVPIAVLAIAASTGGPDALMVVLSALPADLPVPVVIVQHMPQNFSELFVIQLQRVCALPVQLAEHNHPLSPGRVWLAPGGHHLEVHKRNHRLTMIISDDPPEHGCRPAADPLFRSLAQSAPYATLAAVLTGMGADGGPGSRHLKAAGGVIYVQDEATSVIWGMPQAVVQAGAAEQILPLEAIGPALCEHIMSRRLAA